MTLIEKRATDYAVHGKCYHKVVGTQYYNRFIDNMGDYWRSYDDNKTFVMERELTANGYNFA